MKQQTKIAAITGGTGFVGKHLITALIDQGYQINALTRRPQPETENINWIEGDLDNIPSLERLSQNADVFFHLAGLIKARNSSDFQQVNRNSVTTLLDVLHKSGHRPHFILLSSLAARERHLSAYAESKRQGEEILQKFAGDIPWTILRPPGVYGPEDMETLKIFKAIASRIAPMPGGLTNRSSWIFGPDLAQAMIAVARSKNCFHQILDVDDGTKNGYSMQDIYATASNILNIKPLPFVVPKIILKNTARMNVLFSTLFNYIPMVTPDKVNELCFPDWICRGPHVTDMTEWKPQTTLKSGFDLTLKWYKEKKLI